MVNTVAAETVWPDREYAELRVLRMQTKLHQWAVADRSRRFDDLSLIHI